MVQKSGREGMPGYHDLSDVELSTAVQMAMGQIVAWVSHDEQLAQAWRVAGHKALAALQIRGGVQRS